MNGDDKMLAQQNITKDDHDLRLKKMREDARKAKFTPNMG